MKHFFRAILILLFFSGCDTNNDDGCLSPSSSGEAIQFYLENPSTGELLDVTDFEIDVHKSSGELVEINYFSLLNYVSVPLGEQEKSDTYTVRVGDEVVFDVHFSLGIVDREPCPLLITNNLKIEGVNYAIHSYSDIFGYRITIFIVEEET